MRWWARLWRREQLEQQLDRELRFHLDQHTADLVSQGIDPAEARRRAALALGGPEQVKEGCRDVRGTRWLDELTQDCRYAVRALRRRPGFAAVAIGTLALGIGAATVMFTVINGVLLRPLPYPHPERLVVVREQTDWSNSRGNVWAFAYPNFLDCRRDVRTVTVAAWRYNGGILSVGGEAEYVDGLQISADLFPLLGVEPSLGRSFLPNEDRPDGSPVVIVSHGLWLRRFGGAADAIGKPLVFEGKPYTIVGVAPAGLQVAGDADVFLPLGQSADPALRRRDRHPGLEVWARLQQGATLAEAQAELATIGRNLAAEYPTSNAGRTFVAAPLRPDVGDVASTLWLLLAAVSLVLAIACANIASLLLAHAVSREREIAMRAALGAGRLRLMRQCFTESAVLGLLGGGAGVVLALAGARPFVALWPGSLPRAEQVHLDWRVLLFTLAISVTSGVVFGLAPAFRVPVRDLEQMLRGGGRTVAGSPRRLHSTFVISEIALAAVLLTCASVLGRMFLRVSALDPGVDVRNMLVARTALSPGVLDDADKTRAQWDDVLARVGAVPGIRAAAVVDTVPMRDGYNETGYSTTPSLERPDRLPLALATCVTPAYLDVMGIRLRAGRFFNEHDRASSQPVVVIDDVLARTAFGRGEAVGRQLWIPDLGPGAFEVIGVVGHVRHWGLASDEQAAVRAQYYYPFAQLPNRFVRRWSELMSIAVRTTVVPSSVIEPLRHAVGGATGDQVVYEVRTMEQLAIGTLARQRFLLLLFGIFGTLALLMSCIGVYGVLSYLTSHRVPEIGVRMALGATAASVVRLVIAQSAAMIAGGVLVGTIAAYAASRALERLVDGVRGVEPSTFAVTLAVLVASALIATSIPARRASRIDPVTALRQE